jgi:hypothetical protein
MADYQLIINPGAVLRVADNTFIPEDPKNSDWIAYQNWLADGGVPDPYVEPPAPAPSPSPERRCCSITKTASWRGPAADHGRDFVGQLSGNQETK